MFLTYFTLYFTGFPNFFISIFQELFQDFSRSKLRFSRTIICGKNAFGNRDRAANSAQRTKNFAGSTRPLGPEFAKAYHTFAIRKF